jgi:hypothetical protein
MKTIFETVEARIAALLSANLSLASAGGLMSDIEPYLGALVKLGQLAVAVATVVYFVFKTRAVKAAKKDDEA